MSNLIQATENAIRGAENYCKNLSASNIEESEIIRKILIIFLDDLLSRRQFSEEILRALRDIAMASYRIYENTSFSKDLEYLNDSLYKNTKSFILATPYRFKFSEILQIVEIAEKQNKF